MRFVELTLSQITDYTDTEEYIISPVIPITRHRAKSQAKNPRANPEDIVLIIAYNDLDEIIGYIGALPDWLFGDNSKKIAWNSCWWIDPVHGREAAMPLFYRFLDRWSRRVIFAELTPQTYKIICRTGFFESSVFTGCRGYLRLPLAEILPVKNRIFRYLKWSLAAGDFTFNLIWELRLRIWKSLNKKKR